MAGFGPFGWIGTQPTQAAAPAPAPVSTPAQQPVTPTAQNALSGSTSVRSSAQPVIRTGGQTVPTVATPQTPSYYTPATITMPNGVVRQTRNPAQYTTQSTGTPGAFQQGLPQYAGQPTAQPQASAATTPGAAVSPFGPNPFMASPTTTNPSGSITNLNPTQWATQQTAQQVAQMLGGTVLNQTPLTYAPNSPFSMNQSGYMVRLPNGNVINPADIASLYTHGYSQPYIDKLTQQAVAGTGLAGFGTGFESMMSPTQTAAANLLAGGNVYGPTGSVGTPTVPAAVAAQSPAYAQTPVTSPTGSAPAPAASQQNGLQQFLNLYSALASGNINPSLATSSINAATQQGIDPTLLYLLLSSGGSGTLGPLYSRQSLYPATP